jgi:hypothetical protein
MTIFDYMRLIMMNIATTLGITRKWTGAWGETSLKASTCVIYIIYGLYWLEGDITGAVVKKPPSWEGD